MRKDGELALMGRDNITKTDARRRREIVAEKKDIERRAYNIKEQIRCVEEGKTFSGQGLNVAPKLEPIEVEIAKEEAADIVDTPVTNHALIRWLERIHGLDIEAMRRDIYAEAMGEGGVIYKNGNIYKVLKKGVVYVVDSRNRTVITCYEHNSNLTKWKDIKHG